MLGSESVTGYGHNRCAAYDLVRKTDIENEITRVSALTYGKYRINRSI